MVVIDYLAKNGVEAHCDDKLMLRHSVRQKRLSNNKRSRRCQTSMFQRTNTNGETVKRTWLCFSPSMGKLYCYVCKLMATSGSQLTNEGFCDWVHASKRLGEHERSKVHLDAVVALLNRSNELNRTDHELAKQADEARHYWRSVLKRVISVIKFACERGLALRGENETLESASNGNYLGLLELLLDYDDFLKQHIQNHSNLGSGHVNYLSSTICDEIVDLMGKRVLNEIVSRIQTSRYYSISIDSTPDESHVDQLTLVFRYMEKTTPVERFAKFMPNQGHKAQKMYDGLMHFLSSNGIDIQHCRGQSYDNTAAMSGKYNELQAKVVQQNKLAEWVPCAAHSLNLVGLAAAQSCDQFFLFPRRVVCIFHCFNSPIRNFN